MRARIVLRVPPLPNFQLRLNLVSKKKRRFCQVWKQFGAGFETGVAERALKKNLCPITKPSNALFQPHFLNISCFPWLITRLRPESSASVDLVAILNTHGPCSRSLISFYEKHGQLAPDHVVLAKISTSSTTTPFLTYFISVDRLSIFLTKACDQNLRRRELESRALVV
jgi:hypothetical protein